MASFTQFQKNIDIPVRDLDGVAIAPEILGFVPEESARHYGFVPIGMKDGVLEIGVKDQDNISARDAISFIATKNGFPFKIFLISEKDFENVLGRYKGISGEVEKALGVLQKEKQKEDDKEKNTETADDIMQKITAKTPGADDAPITKIVAVIVQNATEGNASDIHIEPTAEKVKVRFRVDGVLYTSLLLPINVLEAVVARVKILANLKLDEKRKPQDGRFTAKVGGKNIDFRVSVMPTYFGEKVVIRILDSAKGVKKMGELGFSERNLSIIQEAIKRPYGLVLITGPTGSGKTTTLYSMMNELDREGSNVLSLEDPIEYSVSGVSQSQIRPEIGYTFANGLRSVLRQDPDIIMVGEIRDQETARLAVQAALTGHLVLSTLHTNNAVGAVSRLVDMGIEPYLLAPTLIMVVAQRLVGMVCQDSKEAVPVDGDIKKQIDKEFRDLPEEIKNQIKIPNVVYNAKSSPTCSTGTRGRVAVAEVLPFTTGIKNVVLKNPIDSEIYKVARAEGMFTMKEDAILKAFAGTIGFEEVGKL